MKLRKLTLFFVWTSLSAALLGGCSPVFFLEQGCTPTSSEGNVSRSVAFSVAVQDLECLSVADFAKLHCEVLDQLTPDVTDLAKTNKEILKGIKKRQEAVDILESDLPTEADLKAPFNQARDSALGDLRDKAEAANYRASAWERDFERVLVANCQQGKQFTAYVAAIDSYEDERIRVVEVATSWAPEGFTIDEDSGVAYKELTDRGCNWGYCVNYEIVSQQWCAVLKATLWINSPLVYDDDGARNVEAGERVRVQMSTDYDLSKVGHEVRFSCLDG